MKHNKLSMILLSLGCALSFSSCEVFLSDYHNFGDFFDTTPPPAPVQTGTNAAQTSFTKGIMWQPSNYDSNGVAIYGYADGRPVYGYTKQGSLIYQVNHIYSGCYVPTWGNAYHYPAGVYRTSTSPL